MNPFRFVLYAMLSAFVAVTAAHAQYEVKVGNFNQVFVAQAPDGTPAAPSGPPVLNNPPPTDRQFSAMGQISGAAGPISNSAIFANRYAANADKKIVLVRATIGGVFASGVPRYSMGDVITPPLVQADGATPADANYWRVQPILPGETIPSLARSLFVVSSSTNSNSVQLSNLPPYLVTGSKMLGRTVNAVSGTTVTLDGNADRDITAATEITYIPPTAQSFSPLATVDVTSASTTATLITVSSVPSELVVGATVLGQPVTSINGTTVILGGNASTAITSSTAVPITPAVPFYYSPHAEKVFASQPGRVSITWLSRAVNAAGAYESKTEEFSVSSSSSVPVRTIFWTEGSFDGPKVQITDTRITTINPVFYGSVPKAVAEEVKIPGYAPISPNLTTLSFQKYNGIGSIQAYNVEGRIFVEYLGNVRLAGNIYEHLGFDIVDIERVPSVNYPSVNLGEEILPHNGDRLLQASAVLSGAQDAANYYGTLPRPDGSSAFYAERETASANDPDDGSPATTDAFNKVVFYWLETGSFGIKWPKFQDRYWQRWSPKLSDYAHYSVYTTGSTPETGVPFDNGTLPEIVYQDDPAQSEAKIDVTTQRLYVTFDPALDTRNRSLLKFSNNNRLWYVNLYTQADERSVDRDATSDPVDGTLITVSKTKGLEVGMIVTGPGISGKVSIVRIVDKTHLILSQPTTLNGASLNFTVESDSSVPIRTTATVGSRLVQPADHENAGFISDGTSYYPGGYLNPFVVGVEAGNTGAIIPVNAIPGSNTLTVRWFKKVKAPNVNFEDIYVPGKVGRYTISYPAASTSEIVIAQGVGTDDLPPAEAAGSVYYQNNILLPGYNPNEEHALMLGGRAYALREDLNVVSGTGFTSQPFVLVAYKDNNDDRPAMHAYKVVRTNAQFDFDYTATAGTLLVKPYPLPLMPLAMVGAGPNRTAKDVEIVGADAPANAIKSNEDPYKGFTFKDRKGFTWVHRGPHDSGSPTLSMKLYYLSRPGFFVPGSGEIPADTVLPFLRAAARTGQPLDINAINANADGSPGQVDEPLTIVYRPAWPTNAPELRVGETLTLPKFGLPQVRGQTSAQIYYQQSLANDVSNRASKDSVTLHDSTREKTTPLDAVNVNLDGVPASIKTTNYQGKIYFQGLPPHLQKRIYVDPLRGKKGTLVFVGTFHDEIAGEDYLDLNVLTASEEAALRGLVPVGSSDKAGWDMAVTSLQTNVETFISNPAQFGSYIPDPTRIYNFGAKNLTWINDPNSAVDSYALTATGQGTGFITLVFGNGNAFTPEGDPVQVKVIKIANQLYVGDLKVLTSSNPLDEQVTMRHSGDFAGKPEDYEFDWRWATGEASAPATYANAMATSIGDPLLSSDEWIIAKDPGATLPNDDAYANAGAAVPLPRAVNVRPVNYVLDNQQRPTTTVIDATSYTDADMAAGYPSMVLKSSVGVNFSSGVPGNIVFSASTGTLDGFVLYVNGTAALAHNSLDSGLAQTAASSGLSAGGLDKQFTIASSFFTAGQNKIEVAIYTTADANVQSSLNFKLESAVETDLVTSGTTWQTPSDPNGLNTNFAIIGGSPSNPFGGPQFVLNDRWFTMRYRPKASAGNVLGTPWSRWMPPQFVEGWVKRVLAAINPFEQRVKDLYNNQANTDVSVLTQAGTKWEGDIALTLENVNDAGLIAIYETVLNRAKNMSINANTNDPDTNTALLLAAGYLNDLYTLIGNEAYADAANSTISLDDQASSTEVNTSRFSFEGQVATSLDEELALLRGRDDSVSPGVRTAPAYNRLYWNYTRGINSGEVIYAVNYNIKEKVGSSTADGVIDESDAQRMFPQGHGDAYGHYLTALTGYYQLLTNANFTWTPRAEAVTVLGQPVTVDFMDERKFAAAAGNVAHAAQQICELVYRQSYSDDPAAGWASYRDQKGLNTQTGITSRQGLDEWVSRSEQGALYHWAVANALVPEVDSYHTGVQKIDRTTVLEISDLASASETFQTIIDNANAHLNPLGLNPGAIAFDLSPSALVAGQSHFEQINGRALQSMLNAAGAFNQAAKMTRSLRSQQNQIDDYTTTIAAQETAYVNQLIDLFGRPYSGDIGAGKLYAQSYAGPDLEHWFIVDRPTNLVDISAPVTVTIKERVNVDNFNGIPLQSILKNTGYNSMGYPELKDVSVTFQPSQFVQYNDVWQPGGLGSRSETGLLQNALLDAQQSLLAIAESKQRAIKDHADLNQKLEILNFVIASYKRERAATEETSKTVKILNAVEKSLTYVNEHSDALAENLEKIGDAIAEYFPRAVGLATDATSPARGAAKTAATVSSKIAKYAGIAAKLGAKAAVMKINHEEKQLDEYLRELDFQVEAVQLAYEVDVAYRSIVTDTGELADLALSHQRALQNVLNVLAKGNRVLAEREIFRQRAAALIQGYRTKDLTFRLFRNEALEQYRSLFDLAGRYTYLAAKSYDYETGLLGTAAGSRVFSSIVASRSLGDLSNGTPQSTTSSHGDPGLAGVMAKLNADFSVAEGRLGINNPDQYGTVFSLRGELYRIQNPGASTASDEAWRQTIEQHILPNLLADADVAAQCRNLRKADGTPVPGILIPFSSRIEAGKNFFGMDLAANDHNYTPTNFATKIYSVGIALPGYIGMDPYATGLVNATTTPATAGNPNGLSATPYLYLIPCGSDFMLAPPLGDTNTLRSWTVKDQALPLPYNLGATSFNSIQFFDANGTLGEQPWIIRKHQAFRPVSNANFFYSTVPTEFTNSRLIGRSVWNSQWKIVIPANTLLSDEQEGLNRFAATVQDIQLFLRTYSHSGN